MDCGVHACAQDDSEASGRINVCPREDGGGRVVDDSIETNIEVLRYTA